MKRLFQIAFGLSLFFLGIQSAQAAICIGTPPPPVIEISEVFPDPKGFDHIHEYVEIYNAGLCEANLGGWKLTDGVGEIVFPDTFTLLDGNYHTIRTTMDYKFDLDNAGTQTLSLIDDGGVTQATFIRSSDTTENKSCFVSGDDCDGTPTLLLDGDWNGDGLLDVIDPVFDIDLDGVWNTFYNEDGNDQDGDGIINVLDWDSDADGDGMPNLRTPYKQGDNDIFTPVANPTLDGPAHLSVVYSPVILLSGTHELETRIHVLWDGRFIGFNVPALNETGNWTMDFTNLHVGWNIFQAQASYFGQLSNRFSPEVHILYKLEDDPPVISETNPVPPFTNDITPEVIINSDEDGILEFSGQCAGFPSQQVTAGDNTITLGPLPADGVYDNCIVTVTDPSTNTSLPLTLTPFELDTVAPSISLIDVLSSGLTPPPGDTEYVRDGDFVFYTVLFDEDVTVVVNTPTTINNVSDLLDDFDDGSSLVDIHQSYFEVGPTDNGLVTPNNVDFTVTDLAGNTLHVTSLSPLTGNTIIADNIALPLSFVNIASNNTNPAYAATNDVVTLSFTSQEEIKNLVVKIAGKVVTQINDLGGNAFEAILTLDGTEPEGPLPFEINYDDFVGNTADPVTGTTDGSSVTYDKTDPMVSSVSVSSDNTYIADDPAFYAKSGHTMTVSFVSLEKLRVPQGVIHGQNVTFTNPSGDQKTWEGTITFGNTDTEGIATFNVPLYDLAGNNNLTLIATTDGTSVLFDRTAPTLPSVTDLGGAQTNVFKYHGQADFRFNGQQDLNATMTAQGSGLNQMHVRFENPVNGVLELATFLGNVTGFTPQNAPADGSPYYLRLNLTDKAGNETGESVVYTQLYGILLEGRVTNINGDAIESVHVQAVSRFGETCNTGQQTCSDSTDGEGVYRIIVAPDQGYNIAFHHHGYYMAKTDVTTETEDLELDAVLEVTLSPKESQRFTHDVLIETLYTVGQPNGTKTYHSVRIVVTSLSGEISITSGGTEGGFIISSLSEITSVVVNDQAVQVIDNGDNTYRILGAGEIQSTGSTDNIESHSQYVDGVITSHGTSSSYKSGDSRIGVIEIPAGGKNVIRAPGSKRDEFVGTNHFWTEEESKAFAAKMNQGVKGKTLSYINRNGYTVFGGYLPGRLPLSTYDDHRIQNQLRYRPYRQRWGQYQKTGGRSSTKKQPKAQVLDIKMDPPETLETKYRAMKKSYHRQPSKVVKPSGLPVGYKKLRAGDEFRPQRTRRTYRKYQQPRFARKSTPALDRSISRIRRKDMQTVRMRIGGRSMPMAAYLEGRNDRRRKKKLKKKK